MGQINERRTSSPIEREASSFLRPIEGKLQLKMQMGDRGLALSNHSPLFTENPLRVFYSTYRSEAERFWSFPRRRRVQGKG